MAAAVATAVAAAACADRKDDDATAPVDTAVTSAVTGTASAPSAARSGSSATTPSTATAPSTAASTAPPTTTATVDPVIGGTLVVAGESEVANPWTPAAMQCDSYCHHRVRTFYDPLAAYGTDLEVHPFLAESITPNAEFTEWTVKVREGVTFHDGTPLDADAVIYNLQTTGTSVLVAAALTDVAKVPSADDPARIELKIEKVDAMTFTIFTGKGGDPARPVRWPRFDAYLTGQWGLIASPTWLEAVKDDPSLASRPVGTGPFVFESYAPRDRLVVTRNPDYWMRDAAGNQLPYLDRVEFRVIEDPQSSAEALRGGEVDMISTASARNVADFQGDDEFDQVIQDELTETNYILIDQSKDNALADRRVRCALSMAIDRQEFVDAVQSGIVQPANGLFSPGQQGYLDDNGLVIEQNLEGAAALIEQYEAETGRDVSFSLGHPPARLLDEAAELLLGWWSEIGVDVDDLSVPQDQFITLALFGDPTFEAFLWRGHAGVGVDQQYFWWHSAGSHPDGELSLNFGRLDDPAIDAGLDAARSATDPAAATAAAEDVNRAFAAGCYYIPLSWSIWGIVRDPQVQGVGQLVLPDRTAARDGAGAAGQFWVHTLFLDAG